MKLILILSLLVTGQALAASPIQNTVASSASSVGTFSPSVDAKAFLASLRDLAQTDARPGCPVPPPPYPGPGYPYPGEPTPPPYYGNSCQLVNPNERDAIGRYCSNGYGIMWNGYILNDACYNNIDHAFNMMNSARVCREPSNYGACEIIQPSVRDQGQRYCDKAYGVSYYGYIVDNTCFKDAENALNKMNSTNACMSSLQYGRCQIMQHAQRDLNGRYCNNTYGVAYDGVIMNNTCYNSLDNAMNQMMASPACRY